MNKLTVGSLFAGIGGFDLGFQRAGFEIKWQVEIDPFCLKVLAKHFPNAKRYEDIKDVGIRNLEPVDIVCGGFPCQDVSIAGKGKGLAGERSGLWFEMHRVISELRPKYVVVENVRMLLRRGIDRVLGSLADIGYDAEWELIRASQFGLPQPRERVWIVAYPNSKRSQRFFQSQDISSNGQGWAGGSENLQSIINSPFVGIGGTPKPLFCGVDERPSDWVDRVGACGNSVVPQIPEWIANRILKHESDRDVDNISA